MRVQAKINVFWLPPLLLLLTSVAVPVFAEKLTLAHVAINPSQGMLLGG